MIFNWSFFTESQMHSLSFNKSELVLWGMMRYVNRDYVVIISSLEGEKNSHHPWFHAPL